MEGRRVLIVGGGNLNVGYISRVIGRACGNVVIATKSNPNVSLEDAIESIQGYPPLFLPEMLEVDAPQKPDRHFDGRRKKHWER